MKKLIKSQRGQALVSLLLISIIGFTVVAAAAILVYGNSQAASTVEQGEYAYYVAQSGIEEGLLRLLRNPNYSGTPNGQPLSLSSGTVVISVSNGLITATGTFQDSVRKIQAQTVYNNGIRTISSWKEVP